MTRLDALKAAIRLTLAQNEDAINAASSLTHLHIDVRFDRSTGIPSMAVISMGMETRVRAVELGNFTFTDEPVYSSRTI